jgi:hypothetical protein
MPAALRRGDTEYVWPETLVRPPSVRLIYLDLNHWVALAKAAVGHPDGQDHVSALEVLREAKASGQYEFPLLLTHVMEVAAIKRHRHRLDVATVMEEFSDFTVLIPRDAIMTLEIEAALDVFGRKLPVPYAPVPLVGRGVLRAYGKVGGLLIRDQQTGEDLTEAVRAGWPGGPTVFDNWREDAERQLDRALLRGPRDDKEDERLRVDGWDPTVARRMADDNAAEERKQAERLAAHPYWRQQRVRDVVAARHLALELREQLEEALAARRLVLEDVCGDPVSTRRFVDSMPSSDVCVSLTSAAHRNPQTRWTRNRIFDTWGLSVAVPYCDFVATDHEAAHTLHSEGSPARLATAVVSSLDALVRAIS